MRIGLVGAGMIGQALAVRFAGAGHEVMISNSRGPETLERLARSIPGRVESGTVADAARFAEVVAVAIPTDAIHSLPAEALARRTVIDVNNYYPSTGRRLPALHTGRTTSSELLASLLPGASTQVTWTVPGPTKNNKKNFFVEIDPGINNGQVQECKEDNNGALVTEAFCPEAG